MDIDSIQDALASFCEEHRRKARSEKTKRYWETRASHARTSDLNVLHTLLCEIKMKRSKPRRGRDGSLLTLRSLSSPKDDYLVSVARGLYTLQCPASAAAGRFPDFYLV